MNTKQNTHISEHQTSFSHLPLKAELLKSLASLGYLSMTPIQEQSLPLMLEKKDLIAQAQTGSGKTAAFGLSILQDLKTQFFGAQALILCPTRELAEQVSQVLRRLACFMPNVKVINLSGGIPMKPQLDSLRHGAHIIVGTPGRILKHLNKGSLDLSQLSTLVLDEADRMLDMGFFDDINTIISSCSKKRQTLLFSATYPEEIKMISKQFMLNPQEVIIETTSEQFSIEQYFYEVSKATNKYPLLKSLLVHYKPSAALIFCNTKQQTKEVTHFLIETGFYALALNGDMEQVDRDLAMICFANHSCPLLVATDVAARGLDIKELPLVINFDLAFEQDVHVHRIGRTGRAGHSGLALSLSTPADAARIVSIEEQQGHPVTWGKIEELIGSDEPIPLPEMATFYLAAGKKDKIRAGDILGALTKDAGLPAQAIGVINSMPLYSYVAIHRKWADSAFEHLQHGKLKGIKVPVKRIN